MLKKSEATWQVNDKIFRFDLSRPIDISIPMRVGAKNVNAWHAETVKIEAVRIGDWVGEVNQGASVNFRNISFNPHGNGTHTECVGHVSKENYSINNCLTSFFFLAQLISVAPEQKSDGDRVIYKEQIIPQVMATAYCEALIIRTLPNDEEKLTKHYSGSNPPYLHHKAASFIQQAGVDHLLIDLPSVDKEKDEGKLLAHKAFWQYPHATQWKRTITELIYVPDGIKDGIYLLNLQIVNFENDASPSKPILYSIL